MRIAVNVRLLLKDRLEGIGWFTCETLKRITTRYPEHEFVFIFDRPYAKEFVFAKNVTPIVVAPPTRHPILFIIWFEFMLPGVLKKQKIDLFISPDGFLSLRSKTPQVAVIHDINFAHRPKDLPFIYRKFYNYFFPRYAKKAARIATVSEYSKSDIVKTYGVEENKIDVVYNGVNELYTPMSEGDKDVVKAKYTQGNPYFLFVGAFSARKNIKGLLQAFEMFKQKDNSGMKLVLVGRALFSDHALDSLYRSMHFKDDVLFVGRQTPENLHRLLASAHALTFVPFFEGFGIPVVEAIQCEVPLICSNTTSIPEVAGNAAVFVNPDDIEQIADAMQRIVADKELYAKLKNATVAQKGKFTWDKSATLFWQTIDMVLTQIEE